MKLNVCVFGDNYASYDYNAKVLDSNKDSQRCVSIGVVIKQCARVTLCI